MHNNKESVSHLFDKKGELYESTATNNNNNNDNTNNNDNNYFENVAKRTNNKVFLFLCSTETRGNAKYNLVQNTNVDKDKLSLSLFFSLSPTLFFVSISFK